MSPEKTAKNDWQKSCDGVLNCIAAMRYTKQEFDRYSWVYKNLMSFLIRRKLIDKPVDKKHTDAFLRYYNPPVSKAKTRQFYIRALRRLLEFHQNGSFRHRQKMPTPHKLSSAYESILAEYQKYRISENVNSSERSAKEHLNDIRHFLHVLCERRVHSIRKIRFDDVQAFIRRNPKLSPGRISNNICAVRSFFRFLVTTQRCPPAILKFVPSFRHARTIRLAAIWPRATVEKLLAVIDRKTNVGKRDYAVTLLVSKLGLRIGDVGSLRIDNIDWRKATIRITQPKTKNLLELPISEDIGKALIDYLLNGRPAVTSRHVFVMHRAPYKDFSASRGLDKILGRYQEKGNVILPEESRRGWHSLRHSLATRLHEESTPLPVIAAILGHASVETTRIYARTNIEMLRSAALEWEES